MRIVLSLAVSSLAAFSFAASDAQVDAKIAAMSNKVQQVARKYTRAEIEQMPKVLEKTGGFVDVAARGVSVWVVDARPKTGGAPDQFAEVFANLSKTNVQVEKTPLADGETPFGMISGRRAARNSMYALAVVEDDKAPGLTVFPEERVAVINAAKYQEGTDPVRREERVHKELWRALGFVSGVGYAPYRNDVLQPVYTVPELDALEYQVMQPMNFQKIFAAMQARGITRARHVPYRLAVKEGWASQPTNEYQKAIWDEVHAIPTEPIKIKPETHPAK